MQPITAVVEEAEVYKISQLFPKKPPGLAFNETDALVLKARMQDGRQVGATFYFCLKPDGTFEDEALEILGIANQVAEVVLKKKLDSIISLNKDTEGWVAEVEVLERKSVPDTQDILGRYEMKFDPEGDLLGYKRIMLRRRADMEMVEEEV